jgi:DNA end-binding protein Ku
MPGMPRSVWNGSISFGLVNIPVRLFPATEQRDPRFHMVDRRTGRRVRYRRVVEEPVPPPDEPSEPEEVEPRAGGTEQESTPTRSADDRPVAEDEEASPPPAREEREVSYADTARGYDVGGGQHVVVDREELEALRPEPSRTIDIEHFVALADVDPVYFEKSYHLAPTDDLAEKPYALLRVAMEHSGRVAVGRFILRSREHLVLIRPTAGILGLETMYLEDEVRKPAEAWVDRVRAVEAEVTDAEVGMAARLIGALAADWDPSQYRDPYRERVLDLVRSRAPVTEPEEAVQPEGASVTDLMDALKASVDALKDVPSRKRAGGSGRR